MGISNDWQILNNLAYMSILASNSGYATLLDASSAADLAAAIGWETVLISDYASVLSEERSGTIVTCPTTGVYGIRPSMDDNEEYLFCITIGRVNWENSNGLRIIDLSTGNILGPYSSFGAPASVAYFRAESTGALALKVANGTNPDFYIDKFYNPKVDKTKWGVIMYPNHFVDLYSGLYLTMLTSYLSATITGAQSLGQFVALKKATAINTGGVFNARNLYMAYVDYSLANKTIELGDTMYKGFNGYYWGYYIKLA